MQLTACARRRPGPSYIARTPCRPKRPWAGCKLIDAPASHELSEEGKKFSFKFRALNDPSTGELDNFGAPAFLEFSRTYLLERPMRARARLEHARSHARAARSGARAICAPWCAARADAKRWGLYSLAYAIMAIKTQLTFSEKEEVKEYGTVDAKVYNLELVNEIAAWILDPDACPTSWDVVLALRLNHTA